MQILGSLSIDEVQDAPVFKFGHESQSRVLLPLALLVIAVLAFFVYEFYKDWKRKRRMNQLLEKGRIPK